MTLRGETFLGDYDWKQAFQDTHINMKSDIFKAVVNYAVKHFIPLTTKNRRRKPRWMAKSAELAKRKKYHV